MERPADRSSGCEGPRDATEGPGPPAWYATLFPSWCGSGSLAGQWSPPPCWGFRPWLGPGRAGRNP
eukprot:578660-Rhodomonas_salina.1